MSESTSILPSLIGTFTGAGLAFLSNWWFQHKTQTRDELCAGRLALFTIRSQMDDFLNYRYAIRHSINQIHQALGDSPEWALARPMGFSITESNTFDFKSLAFLLSTETGREAFVHLQFAEQTYLDFIGRLTDFNQSAQEIQRTLAPFHQTHGNATLGVMEVHLGPELCVRMRDHQRAIVLRLDRDENRYRKTFQLLRDEMTKRFDSKAAVLNLDVLERLTPEKLPPLPIALTEYLKTVPNADL